MRLGDLDALKKEFALLMWKEYSPYDTVKVCDIVNQTLDFIDNAPTVEAFTDMKGSIDNTPTVAINNDFYKTDKSNPINRSDLFQ